MYKPSYNWGTTLWLVVTGVDVYPPNLWVKYMFDQWEYSWFKGESNPLFFPLIFSQLKIWGLGVNVDLVYTQNFIMEPEFWVLAKAHVTFRVCSNKHSDLWSGNIWYSCWTLTVLGRWVKVGSKLLQDLKPPVDQFIPTKTSNPSNKSISYTLSDWWFGTWILFVH